MAFNFTGLKKQGFSDSETGTKSDGWPSLYAFFLDGAAQADDTTAIGCRIDPIGVSALPLGFERWARLDSPLR